MISEESLLVDAHRIRLDQDNIDKMIALCVSKRFIERVRRKEAFISIMFHDALYNEHASTNEE